MRLGLAMDFLQSLGALALGSRLRRAGVAIQAATQAWLDQQGFPLGSTQMPVIAALHRQGAMPVGALAAQLGQTQPGVTRLSAQLEADGWVASFSDPDDRRARRIGLTEAGARLAASADASLWPEIARIAAALCEGMEGDFIAQLSELENRLADRRLERLFAEAGKAGAS